MLTWMFFFTPSSSVMLVELCTISAVDLRIWISDIKQDMISIEEMQRQAAPWFYNKGQKIKGVRLYCWIG